MRTSALAALAALLAAAGCSLDSPDTSGTTNPPVNNDPLGDGRIFVAWTIAGAAPNLDSCNAVDHLSLKLGYKGGTSVRIEPIPCLLTRFRYDGLPTGTAQLTLTALDRASCAISDGAASVNVSPAQPADPSPTVAMAAPHACR